MGLHLGSSYSTSAAAWLSNNKHHFKRCQHTVVSAAHHHLRCNPAVIQDDEKLDDVFENLDNAFGSVL